MQQKYPKGFLQQNLDNCKKKTVCEGGCEHHEDEIQVARVIDNNGSSHDWDFYTYCPAAIKEDKRRGFDIILEDQEEFLRNL